MVEDRSSRGVRRPADLDLFDMAAKWQLATGVTVDERHGSSRYFRGALEFLPLRCPDFQSLITLLEAGHSTESALQQAGVPRPQWNAYVRTLDGMRGAGLIVRVEKDPMNGDA